MKKKEETYVFETADGFSYDMLKQYAKENKLFMTDAEHALWNMLKGKGMGYKFRRQHIIGDYIVDFVNLHYKLVVEIDGKYHFKGEQPVSDATRTADLNKRGITVVRFTNEEVMGNINRVAYQIKDIIRHMDVSFPDKPAAQREAKKTNQPSQATVSTPSSTGEGRGGASIEGKAGAPVQAWDRTAWAVDAACSGNPGPMEYQCVDLATGAQVFHYGPVHGTNNIGEFLAIVHALALMEQRGITDKVIYSDSYNAILWVSKKQCKTKLERTPATEPLYRVIARAEQWLRTHHVKTPIIKWETKKWGEIPADFGNKK